MTTIVSTLRHNVIGALWVFLQCGNRKVLKRKENITLKKDMTQHYYKSQSEPLCGQVTVQKNYPATNFDNHIKVYVR